jgi:hypothetical protein
MKAEMKKVAGKAVKGHEKKMHAAKKYQMGGRVMPAQANMGGGMRGLDRAAAMSGRPMGMKKGGSVDGCATKGKTKGMMVKMAKGGMMKKGSRGC